MCLSLDIVCTASTTSAIEAFENLACMAVACNSYLQASRLSPMVTTVSD